MIDCHTSLPLKNHGFRDWKSLGFHMLVVEPNVADEQIKGIKPQNQVGLACLINQKGLNQSKRMDLIWKRNH